MWPQDWRKQFAGENADLEKRLGRFDSPLSLAKSYLSLEQRFRSGELKTNTPLPEGADEATVKKWREENGLPVSFEAYNILPEGTKMEDLDAETKESISAFQKSFLEGNLSADQASTVSKGIIAAVQKQLEVKATQQAELRDTCEDTLRSDWGMDYRNNLGMNMAHMTKVFGEDLGPSILLAAELPDGRRLGDIPEFSKAINQWARAEGGDILVDGGSAGAKTVDSRIAEIEGIMSSDMSKYTPAIADEYGKLIEKREARKGK